MRDIMNASLLDKTAKHIPLEHVRTLLEILKHLVRIEHELHIIDQKTYLRIEGMLIETSKMANGWLRYLTQNPTT